jgi:hypothetical protein
MLQAAVLAVQAAPPVQAAVVSFTLGQILAWGFGIIAVICGLLGSFLVWYAKQSLDKLSSIDNELKNYKTHVEVTYKQKSECAKSCEIPDITKVIEDSLHKETKGLVKFFKDLFKDHKLELKAKA